MNISKIREKLENEKGKVIHFKYNGARNQIEEFNGTIENTYNAIFTIRLNEDNNKIKSFTYSDVLTEILELIIE
ncbi:MAG: Veg family protein [Bacilli bacterium]|nr:Veg family protein [Bacilli bacterium]